MKQHYFLLACTAALTALAAGQTQAQTPFTITFTPDTLSGTPSDLVYYSATFANTSTTDYFVTGASFNSGDPNAGLLQGFFSGDPVNGDPNTGAFEVLGNTSLTVTDVFALQLDPAQPGGTYHGFATFTGQTAMDYPAGNDVELGTGSLILNVPAAVPESSSSVGFGLLLALGAGSLVWRRHKAKLW